MSKIDYMFTIISTTHFLFYWYRTFCHIVLTWPGIGYCRGRRELMLSRLCKVILIKRKAVSIGSNYAKAGHAIWDVHLTATRSEMLSPMQKLHAKVLFSTLLKLEMLRTRPCKFPHQYAQSGMPFPILERFLPWLFVWAHADSIYDEGPTSHLGCCWYAIWVGNKECNHGRLLWLTLNFLSLPWCWTLQSLLQINWWGPLVQ